MPETPSLLEFIQQKKKAPSLLDFIKQEKVPSLSEFIKAQQPTEIELTPEEQALRLENLQKSVTDYMKDPEAGYIQHPGEKIARRVIEGFFDEATLGSAKLKKLRPEAWAKPEEEPETWYEGIAKGVGQFTGFFASPLPIAKYGLKLLGKGVRFTLGKGGRKVLEKAPGVVKRVAGYASKAPLEIGTASAISDVTEMGEAPQRFAQGATWGAIFTAAGLTHVTKSKLINQILSQGGGRAFMALTGQYPPESLTTENLPNLIFQEAISTYFLRYGMSPKALLTGKLNAKQKGIRKNVDDAIFEANKEAGLTDGTKLPTTTEIASNRLGMEHAGEPVSPEALSRQKVQSFVMYDAKTKKTTPLIGVDAIDIQPKPHEAKIAINKQLGKIDYIDYGKNIPESAKAGIEKGVIAKGIEPEITQEQAQKISFVDTFAYDVKTKSLKPRMGEAAKDLPGEHEILFRRNPDTGEIIFRDRGKGTAKLTGKGVKIELKAAEKQLTEWDKSPFGKVDDSMKMDLKNRLADLNSNIQDFPTFLRGLGIDYRTATVTDWLVVEQTLAVMKLAPPEKRMDAYMKIIGLKEDRPITDSQISRFRAKDDATWEREWIKKVAKAKKTPEDERSILSKTLTLKNISDLWWQDVRFTMQDAELWTGIPFYEKFVKTSEGRGRAKYETETDFIPIADLSGIRKRDGRKVEDYFYLKASTGEEIALTPRQREIVEACTLTFASKELDVRFMRTKTWIEARKKGLVIDEFKKQKELLPVLEEALKIYDKGGDSALRAFLSDQNFGTIETGSYLPEQVLGGKFKIDYDPEWKIGVDWVSQSMLATRKSRVEANLATFHEVMKKSPLTQRIHAYLRGMNNQKYMGESLAEWKELVGVFGGQLDNTSGFGQYKYYTFLDGIEMMLHRMKGMPIKHGKIVGLMKWVQKWFFRAFPIKPHAWTRNWMQPIVLSPHKDIVYDPKWHIRNLGDVGRKYKNLPEYAREHFETHVIQFDPIRYEFFFLDQTPKGIARIPGGKQYIQAAEAVGSIYARVDTRNRKATFIPMFRAAEHFINAYRAGEIDYKTLNTKLGIDKLRYMERKQFDWLMSEKQDDKAKLFLAQWEAVNTNFIYDRSEKSFFEMTPTGEGFTNILTWSKGVLQLTENATKRIIEGTKGNLTNPKKWDYRKIAYGTEILLTMMLAGRIVNKAQEILTNSPFRKYSDYKFPDTMLWEFGGVSIGIVREFSGKIFEVIRTLQSGTPETKRRAMIDLAGYIDNVAVRQMLPFANNALAFIESMFGYSYISPLRDLFSKKMKKVDRTFLESAAHAFFAKDPNKSRDTYKWLKKRRAELYREAIEAKNPAWKEWKMAHYETIDYYCKLLKRYQPK